MKVTICLFWMIWTLYLVFQLGKSEVQLEEKSELRPAWGLKFDFLGKMLHGLNRYHLIVGIKIPNFLFEVRDLNLDINFCDMFSKINKTTHLFFTCNRTWPVYLDSLRREQEYRKHINRIVLKQLPAVIPGFQMSDDPDSELDLNYFIDDIGTEEQRVYLGKNMDSQDSSTAIPVRDNRSAMKPTPFSEIVSKLNTATETDRLTMNPIESWFPGIEPTQFKNEKQTLGERFKDQGLQNLLVEEPVVPLESTTLEPFTTYKPTNDPITPITGSIGRWDVSGHRITRRPRHRQTPPPMYEVDLDKTLELQPLFLKMKDFRQMLK